MRQSLREGLLDKGVAFRRVLIPERDVAKTVKCTAVEVAKEHLLKIKSYCGVKAIDSDTGRFRETESAM